VTLLGALAKRHMPSIDEYGAGALTMLADGTPGANVSEDRLLGITAYFRGVSVLSSTMAGLPLKVYKRGTRELIRQRTIIDNPNPRQTPFETWQTLYANAITWGNAYARIVRNSAGIPVEIWPIHPRRVTVEDVGPSDRNPAGVEFIVQVTVKGGVEQRRLTNREIFHLPFLSVNGITGVPPIRVARTVLGLAATADETAATFYRKRGRLAGVLQTDAKVAPEHATAIKKDFRSRYMGASAAGEVPLLHSGLKFVPLDMNPQDAELLVSRKYSVSDMARLIGIPPHMLFDVERSTSWGSGIEEQTLGFQKFTLLPWGRLSEQRIARQLLPGGWEAGDWYAEYSMQGLERGDSKSRSALYHGAIVDGWLSRNEVRALENLEPVDGLDEYLAPSNMTLISVDGQLVPLSAKGTQSDGTSS
jgi:HK97 family phage portal protein